MRGRRPGAAAAALAFLLIASPAGAVTKTVSFDDVAAGTRLTNEYRDSQGVFWQQYDPRPLVSSVPGQAKSGDRVGEVQSGSFDCSCEDFQVNGLGRLNPTARSVSVWVGVSGASGPATITLEAYNTGSAITPIASQSAAVTPGAALVQLTVTSPNVGADISSVRLRDPEGQSIYMDDLAITTPDMPSPPDFGFTIGGDPPSVPVGNFVDSPINIGRFNGSNGDIAFTVSNLPPGMNAQVTPSTVTGTNTTATLRLSADDNATRFEQYRPITITGTAGTGAGSGHRTVQLLVRIVDNCTKEYRGDFIDLRADCIKALGPDKLQVVNQKVRLDGLVVEPASGDRTLTIDKKAKTITSDGDLFAVSHPDLPELQIYVGPINWDLGTPGGGPKTILDYDITGVKKLKGIPVQRLAAAFTKAGKTNLSPTLRLGFWPFSYIGALTATTQVTIDNDHNADFSGLEIKVDRIPAVAFELKDLDVKWLDGGTWSGSTKAILRFLSPYEIGAGFGLKNGDFDFARGSVGNLNVSVSPGVFLQRIGFEVKRTPLTLIGSIGLSGGPSLAGKTAISVDGALKAVLADPWVVEVSGKAKIADEFELGSAFVRYTEGGLFEFGGKANWNLSVVYINGSLAGFLDGAHNKFNLEGSVQGCIPVKYLPDPCAGVSALVSDIGVAGCIDLTIFSGGFGHEWGDGSDLFSGCDLSRWRSTAGASVYAVGAGQGRRFTLPANLPSAAFEITGVGDAPGVTLTGPHGEKVTVSRDNPYVRQGNFVAAMGENNVTYLVVKRPAAGTWTLTDDGRVGIGRVREAVGLPDPSVRAQVTGRGHDRVLHWRLRRLKGQRVTFVEAGKNLHKVIATVAAASGQAAFHPADGRAERRKIIALVEQDGLLRRSIDAGSYLAPPRLRPVRPTRLRLARRGSRLVVSWRAPRYGFRHVLYFQLGDGRRLLRVTGPAARSLTLRGVAPRYGASVTIAGMTHANGHGPTARAAIAGLRPGRPATGAWRMTSAFASTRKGSFRIINSGRSVADLRVTPGSDAGASCGTAELRVVQRPGITPATLFGAGIWIVGHRSSRSVDGAAVRVVTVRRSGHNVRGTLKMSYASRRKANGELTAPGCRVVFSAKR